MPAEEKNSTALDGKFLILFFNSATFNDFAVLQINEVVRLISNLKNTYAFSKTVLSS